MPSVKTTTSKRLGELLLKGWAMLADNCPDCQVPLMKARDSQERLCVNCSTTYVPDGQGLRPIGSAGGEDAAGDSEAGGSASTSGRGGQSAGVAAVSAQSNGGARGGRRGKPALHGTEGAQVAVPNGVGHSGQEDKDKEEEEEVADYDPRADPRLGPFSSAANASAPDSKAAGAAVATAGAAAASAGSGRKQQQQQQQQQAEVDVADLLSSKMLQGWALLDKYCPRCCTVLVRSKATRQMFCVACDAWVVPEGEQPQPQQQSPPPPAQQQEQQEQQSPPPQHQPHATSAAAAEGGRPHAAASPAAAAAGAPDAAQPNGAAGTSTSSPRHQAQAAPTATAAAVPAPLASAAVHTGGGAAGFLADVLGGVGPAAGGAAAGVAYSGYESSSRGSSPPPVFPVDAPFLVGGAPSRLLQPSQHPHQQPPQQHPAANASAHANAHTHAGSHQPSQHLRANFAAGLGAGSGSGGKSPAVGGNAMLLSVSRTVALKMTEAQQQLERISVLELDRARGLVGFIAECLDLLAKLHRLQAQ